MPSTQTRGYNRPPRQFFQRPNWQLSNAPDGILKCTYCEKDGHRQGPDCELWCKHREERGIPIVRYPQATRGPRPDSATAPPPAQANAIIVEILEEEVKAGSTGNQKSPAAVNIQQDMQAVKEVLVNCDCSNCILIEDCEEESQEVSTLAVTRSEMKKKGPIHWKEQEGIRKKVTKKLGNI